MPEGWILSRPDRAQRRCELRKMTHITAAIMHGVFRNICSIILKEITVSRQTMTAAKEGSLRRSVSTQDIRAACSVAISPKAVEKFQWMLKSTAWQRGALHPRGKCVLKKIHLKSI